MKKNNLVLFVLLVFIILISGCGDTGVCENSKEFKIPSIDPVDSDGWEAYSSSIILNKDTVVGLAPGTKSPEAAVVHFYASKIRGDSCFEQVLPKDIKKGRLIRALKRIAEWKFLEVKLLKRNKLTPDKYWIKIFMKLEIKGKTDSGTDEATVEKIDGRWYLTDPPT